MPKRIDNTGKKYGRWTVLDDNADNSNPQQTKALCQCECGTTILVRRDNLRSGISKSCGCLNIELIKERTTVHGMRSLPEYSIWKGLRSRINNPKNERWQHYGGRGIYICEEWINSFMAFYNDMGPRPFPSAQIDRIDNNGPYSKANCRWVSRKENANNKQRTIYLTYQGETKPLGVWASKIGIIHQIIYTRIKRLGWTVEKALTVPPHKRRSKKRKLELNP